MAYEVKGNYENAMSDFTETIRLDPRYAPAYFSRGRAYESKGEGEKALADYDIAIRASPTCPYYYEKRAETRIRRGDYDGGIADLRTAIRLDPNDTAAKFEPWPKQTLSAEAIKHGEEQVRQMLRDRPAMAEFGDKAAVLRDWAARKFAGEDIHERIMWDCVEPEVANAESHPTKPGSPGLIRIRATRCDGPNKGKKQSFEELWGEAVFELYNVTNGSDVERIKAEAASNKLTKEMYAAAILGCESHTAEKTRAFYNHVYLPWAKEQHVATEPKRWYVSARSDPRKSLIQSTPDTPAWKHYEHNYDLLRLNTLTDKNENEAAIELATKLLKQSTSGKESAELYFHRGIASRQKGDPDKAIADFTEAIKFDPALFTAYVSRATAFRRKGDQDRAIADATEAIRLAPKYEPAFACRGRAFLAKGEYDNAIADLSEAIKLNPRQASAYLSRATAYSKKGEMSKGEADFEEAQRLGYTGK